MDYTYTTLSNCSFSNSTAPNGAAIYTKASIPPPPFLFFNFWKGRAMERWVTGKQGGVRTLMAKV